MHLTRGARKRRAFQITCWNGNSADIASRVYRAWEGEYGN